MIGIASDEASGDLLHYVVVMKRAQLLTAQFSLYGS